MALLYFYLFLAIGVSFLCSILEAALLSLTPTHIALLDERGTATGRRLRRLKRDIDQPLAAILSLNTIAHTFGAAGVGAQAQLVFGEASLGIVSAIVTLLILVFSEIIPKTLGAAHSKSLAPFTAITCIVLIYLTWPLVQLSKMVTRGLSSRKQVPTVSREELQALAIAGSREGILAEVESRIFLNLIRFKVIRVRDIMTPRVTVGMLQGEQTVLDVMQSSKALTFSRVPIYGESHEDIRGYVLKSDILLARAEGRGESPLKDLAREVFFVPEVMSLDDLLRRLLARREPFAVVVDEYGGLAGVVTMEDVLETLLGMEIVDESDTIEDLRDAARKRWRQRARELGLDLPAPLPSTKQDANNDEEGD